MTSNIKQAPKSYFLTWRYLLFWMSSLLSNIGSWMQEVVQPWLVLSLSGSALWVGVTGFVAHAPGLLFTLPGGLLADRFDRKMVIFFFQIIQFLFVISMLILMITGLLKVWMILIVSFVVGSTDALCNPSLQTLVPSLVDHKDIHRAVALNATQFNLSRILGPAIAGIVIVRFGSIACFGANVASYVPFFIAIWFIYPGKMDKKKFIETSKSKPVVQLREILHLLRDQSVRLPLTILFVANFFCGPLVSFSSVLVKEIFHSGLGNFGWAMTAFGGGALIGAGSSFIPLPTSFSRSRLASMAAVLQGILVIAIALNHSLVLLYILLVFAGAVQVVVNISINAYLQESAADSSLGRVASLYQLGMYSGLSLGALLTGLVVAKLNIVDALLVNGCLATAFQFSLLWKKVRRTGGAMTK